MADSQVRIKQTTVPKRDPRKHQYEKNKCHKKLRRLVGEALTDFNMLSEGDKVMVCLSGGKDSYTLLDMMLSFKRSKMAEYLKFDEDTHTVQIIGDAPPEILEYSDRSKFDVEKLYEQYLRCVYQAVNEMSKNPSEENFESLSIDWKPCTFGGNDKFSM